MIFILLAINIIVTILVINFKLVIINVVIQVINIIILVSSHYNHINRINRMGHIINFNIDNFLNDFY